MAKPRLYPGEPPTARSLLAAWLLFPLLFLPHLATAQCERVFGAASAPPAPSVIRLDIWKLSSDPARQASHAALTSTHGNPFTLLYSGEVVDQVFYDASPRTLRRLQEDPFLVLDPMISLLDGHQRLHPEKTVGQHFYPGSLLEMLQEFSLIVMQDRNAIDPNTRQLQEAISRQIKLDQITFVEVSEVTTESGLSARRLEQGKRKFRRLSETSFRKWSPASLSNDPRTESPDDKDVHIKTGAAWLISGNLSPSPSSGTLPLETSKLSKPIDRREFPLVFEIGRAAQTTDGAFSQALRAIAFAALEEVITRGHEVADATVFAHALDRTHRALYERIYKMSHHSDVVDQPAESILKISLKKLLEVASVEHFDEVTDKLIRLGEGKITPEVASLVWHGSRNLFSPFYRTAEYHHSTRDFTGLISLKVAQERLRKTGISAPASALIAEFLEAKQLDDAPEVRDITIHNPRTFAADLPRWLRSLRAIEIHDMGWDRKKFTDPQGLALILLSTYTQALANLREAGEKDPAGFLELHDIHFVITGATMRLDLATLPIRPDQIDKRVQVLKLNPAPGEIVSMAEVQNFVFRAATLRRLSQP